MKKIKKIIDADTGEIYIIPKTAEQEADKIPAHIDEEEFPHIHITEDNYNANAMIADLNKQLIVKEKELKRASKKTLTIDKKLAAIGISVICAVIVVSSAIGFSFLKKSDVIVNETSVVESYENKTSENSNGLEDASVKQNESNEGYADTEDEEYESDNSLDTVDLVTNAIFVGTTMISILVGTKFAIHIFKGF